MNYTAENLKTETIDEFFDRMIEQDPEHAAEWEIRRKESKDFEKWNKEHPAPAGYVNCFPGWSV